MVHMVEIYNEYIAILCLNVLATYVNIYNNLCVIQFTIHFGKYLIPT